MFGNNRAVCRDVLVATAALLVICAATEACRAGFEIPLNQLGESSLDAKQQQLQTLLEKSGGDPYIIEELGRIAYRRSNPNLAKELWDRAAKQEPNIASNDVQLVFADIASGQRDSAQKRLDALDIASTTDAHAIIAAGELALTKNDLKTANQFFMRALDAAPQLPATHQALGHLSEILGQIENARSSYKKMTELQPDRVSGWLLLGALEFRQDRPNSAMEAYRKAEKCKGNQPLAETRMGEAYYLRGDNFSAYQLYKAAVSKNADDPFPRLRLAQILERSGRSYEAQKELDQIIKTIEYPEALKAAAAREIKASNWNGAIDFYKRALKANPDDWVVANNLALLMVQTKAPANDAVETAEKALTAAGQPVAALLGTKGCALWYAGKIDEAEPLLKQAVTAVPNSSWTRYCYGQVLLAKNQPEKAREQFAACLFLEPTFERREEVNKIVATLDKEGHSQWKPVWEIVQETSKPATPDKNLDETKSVLRQNPDQKTK